MLRENLLKTLCKLNVSQIDEMLLIIEEEKSYSELRIYLQKCINLLKQ